MSFDPGAFRRDFPPLAAGRPPVYFDNACVTLRPRAVIAACARYYEEFPGCADRGTHAFGREASARFRKAREAAAAFIGAPEASGLIFTRNATEGLNLVARSMYGRGPVLTTELEHNSNLLPWLERARRGGGAHRAFGLAGDLAFSLERFEAELRKGTALVSVPHRSHVTGCEYPLREICALAHKAGALVLADGAQGASFGLADVKGCGADFYVFSAHKALGPSGLGCLYASPAGLELLEPLMLGGGTVDDVADGAYTLAAAPRRFEAGLQDYAGALGLEAAAAYLRAAGPEAAAHAAALNAEITEGLRGLPGLKILGPASASARGPVLNFHVDGVDSLELAALLDSSAGIMTRAGRHCAHSWYNAAGVPPSVRVSLHLYNTGEEARLFVKTLSGLIKYLYR